MISTTQYIRLAFRDHLNDSRTYNYIDNEHKQLAVDRIRYLFNAWIKKYKKLLSKHELHTLCQVLKNNKDPFSKFYLLMKVHKSPLKTRPIVSCSGSLLEKLAVWVDTKLQSVARAQASYISSSYDLKQELLQLHLPPGSKLFTADAIAFYTNINTAQALRTIGHYLHENTTLFPDVPVNALMEALRLVMDNNIFEFGDTVWHQRTGMAMGTPPAPSYATLYYAIHENEFVPSFPNLLFYRRYIDDVFGIWKTEIDRTDLPEWTRLANTMPYHDLKWDVNPLSTSVDFLDLTISIHNHLISTTLFEKALNLYLFIPPHSAHPPGVLTGIVYGHLIRLHTLCSDPVDIHRKTQDFYKRLLIRGYKPEKLKPLFQKAYQRAIHYTPWPKSDQATNNHSLFLHLQYHPNDPPSSHLQENFREYVLSPRYKHPLPNVRNHAGNPTGINRMIVCYSRAPNLGDLLSYRKLPTTGPQASSFRITGS